MHSTIADRQARVATAASPSRHGEPVAGMPVADLPLADLPVADMLLANPNNTLDEHCNSAFLSGIRHELTMPMNGVLGMLDLLLDSNLSSAQRELATSAIASAENLFATLNNMVDARAAQMGLLTLAPVTFDLVREVEAIAKVQIQAANSKGLELLVQYPPAFHRMLIGDRMRIGQALTILLDNAIKASDQGRLVAAIEVSIDAADRCRLTVSVSDTGPALGADLLERLQGAASGHGARVPHRASGSDLVLCKQLVELMEGTMGADQNSVRGNKLWFVLELALAPSVLTGVRMLFVDGQADSRLALEQELTGHGLRASGYESAAQAIAALEQGARDNDPYRIAVLDHQMPGIDGETLGIALKCDPVYRDTRLVLLSTLSRASDAQRFAHAGFSAFLSKPVSTPIMLDALATLCAGMQTGSACAFLTSPSAAAQAPRVCEEMHPFAGYRILVIDADTVNQMVALRMLDRQACHTDLASDGATAGLLLAAHEYDLVLLDCQMAPADIAQTMAMIRGAYAGARRIPIIGWSATASLGEQGLRLGMDEVIAMPIRTTLLRDTLGRWLHAAARPAAPDGADELDEISAMFGASFPQLAALYLADSPQRIAALFRANAQNDTVALGSTAHAFSGSSASIGAAAVAALCRELELGIKSALPIDIGSRLAAIELAFAKVESRLHAMIA